MKMNKWTIGLAAAGVISLASVAQAQDGGALSTPKLGTSILTGYVSTSYHWAVGKDQGESYDLGDRREDRFAINVVSLTLASAPSSGEWGAGYNVQLWVGPDADDLGLGGDENSGGVLKNAYISFGDDEGSVAFGRFDSILGMDKIDYNLNPHFGHSNGYAIEPHLHEGLKATFGDDEASGSFLVANTIDPSSNGASGNTERKTYGVAFSVSPGKRIDALGGARIDLAWINGDTNGQTASGSVSNFYFGLVVPVSEKLSAGLAWDVRKDGGGKGQSDSVVGLHFEYAVSDQTKINVRGERVNDGPFGDEGSDSWDLTTTLNYRLWDGVLSRLEYRYTAMDDAVGNEQEHSHGIWANLIYEF